MLRRSFTTEDEEQDVSHRGFTTSRHAFKYLGLLLSTGMTSMRMQNK